MSDDSHCAHAFLAQLVLATPQLSRTLQCLVCLSRISIPIYETFPPVWEKKELGQVRVGMPPGQRAVCCGHPIPVHPAHLLVLAVDFLSCSPLV